MTIYFCCNFWNNFDLLFNIFLLLTTILNTKSSISKFCWHANSSLVITLTSWIYFFTLQLAIKYDNHVFYLIMFICGKSAAIFIGNLFSSVSNFSQLPNLSTSYPTYIQQSNSLTSVNLFNPFPHHHFQYDHWSHNHYHIIYNHLVSLKVHWIQLFL